MPPWSQDRTAISTLFYNRLPITAEFVRNLRRHQAALDGTLWVVDGFDDPLLLEASGLLGMGDEVVDVPKTARVRLMHPLDLATETLPVWADRLMERGHDPRYQVRRRHWRTPPRHGLMECRLRRRVTFGALVPRGWEWTSRTSVELRIGDSRVLMVGEDKVEGRWRLEIRLNPLQLTDVALSEVLLDAWDAGGDVPGSDL
ncbi:MAG: hypothetical protein H6737_24540 [Alphaproteobacteria bacterium]|nr:hypothetical protein [Alphaproteobacteria bacterium]